MFGDFRTNRYMNFGISSIGGYHPAKLLIYEEFMRAMEEALQKGYIGIIDMLNVKYLVAGNPLPDNPVFKKVWEGTNYKGERQIVYENGRMLPRVFLVGGYEVAKSDEALQLLASGARDPRATVLLNEEPAIRPVSADGATAAITGYGFNEIHVDASLPSPAILVLSEIFYPKWRVWVDGEEGEIIQANHILRAVALPAGDHQIVFLYDRSLLKKSLIVSVVTFAIALVALLVSGVRNLRGVRECKHSS